MGARFTATQPVKERIARSARDADANSVVIVRCVLTGSSSRMFAYSTTTVVELTNQAKKQQVSATMRTNVCSAIYITVKCAFVKRDLNNFRGICRPSSSILGIGHACCVKYVRKLRKCLLQHCHYKTSYCERIFLQVEQTVAMMFSR